jgi:hypothetical protein
MENEMKEIWAFKNNCVNLNIAHIGHRHWHLRLE